MFVKLTGKFDGTDVYCNPNMVQSFGLSRTGGTDLYFGMVVEERWDVTSVKESPEEVAALFNASATDEPDAGRA